MQRFANRFTLSVGIIALAAACSSGAEQQVLRKYFDASKLRDQGTLANVATVSFDREQEGSVDSFSVVSVSDERRTPLKLREYAKEYQEAKSADDEFLKKIRAYQEENKEAIGRVTKAEKAKAKIGGQDLAVQTAWSKWRADLAEHSKALSEKRKLLAGERRLAEISTYDARRPINVEEYDGELVAKDVTIDARVNKGGQVSNRQMVVTLEKAELKGKDGDRSGRWIVTGIK
jgi:hypothetical protein